MEQSVSEYIRETHGINIRPGAKGECFLCGKHTMSITPDDTLAKCFHPACGHHLHASRLRPKATDCLSEMMDSICSESHSKLVDQDGIESDAYKYLVEKRQIDPGVVSAAMIGVVPQGYSVDAAANRALLRLSEFRNTTDPVLVDALTKQVQTTRDKLSSLFRDCPGWICFFYTDHEMRITGIRLRRPFSKDIKSHWVGGRKGVFGFGLFIGDSNASPTTKVVEGEFNMLQLQSLANRVAGSGNQPIYESVVAAGSAMDTDFETIGNLCDRPLFIHDNDSAGEAVVEKALDHMHLFDTTTSAPHKDIDELIMASSGDCTAAWQAYLEVINAAVPKYRHFAELAHEVDNIRRSEGKEFQIHQRVEQLIFSDLKMRGVFYHDGIQAYYFLDETKCLVTLDRDDMALRVLMSKYHVNDTERVFGYVLSNLNTVCYTQGKKIRVQRFAYYSKATRALYVQNAAHSMIRVNASCIKTVDNGTDGVMFLQLANFEPFTLLEPTSDLTLFRKYVTEKINFSDDETLTVSERRQIFELWFLSVFFESLMPTKPLVAFVGGKGSGKSMTLRKVGMLLFGSRFNLIPLPNDPRDFDAVTANSYYLVLDNTDSMVGWLEDKLAVLATGGNVQARKLFTTNEVSEVEYHCFLGLTSRTPHFRRDDIADRLLIFNVERFKKFISENQLRDELLEHREEILTEVIYHLQKIVQAYSHGAQQYSGPFRMADFASFAVTVSAIDKPLFEMPALLDRMVKSQSEFTMTRDPMYQLICLWLEQSNEGRWVTTKLLYEELKQLAKQREIRFNYLSDASFFQKFSGIRSNLESFFEIKERRSGGRKREVCFRTKPEEKDDFLSEIIQPKPD